MQQVDIKNVNADELVDISEIEIDTKQSVQRRVKAVSYTHLTLPTTERV